MGLVACATGFAPYSAGGSILSPYAQIRTRLPREPGATGFASRGGDVGIIGKLEGKVNDKESK